MPGLLYWSQSRVGGGGGGGGGGGVEDDLEVGRDRTSEVVGTPLDHELAVGRRPERRREDPFTAVAGVQVVLVGEDRRPERGVGQAARAQVDRASGQLQVPVRA